MFNQDIEKLKSRKKLLKTTLDLKLHLLAISDGLEINDLQIVTDELIALGLFIEKHFSGDLNETYLQLLRFDFSNKISKKKESFELPPLNLFNTILIHLLKKLELNLDLVKSDNYIRLINEVENKLVSLQAQKSSDCFGSVMLLKGLLAFQICFGEQRVSRQLKELNKEFSIIQYLRNRFHHETNVINTAIADCVPVKRKNKQKSEETIIVELSENQILLEQEPCGQQTLMNIHTLCDEIQEHLLKNIKFSYHKYIADVRNKNCETLITDTMDDDAMKLVKKRMECEDKFKKQEEKFFYTVELPKLMAMESSKDDPCKALVESIDKYQRFTKIHAHLSDLDEKNPAEKLQNFKSAFNTDKDYLVKNDHHVASIFKRIAYELTNFFLNNQIAHSVAGFFGMHQYNSAELKNSCNMLSPVEKLAVELKVKTS